MAERCARHPGARAGWRCRSCGAALCPGCTFLHRTGTVELPGCARCRGFADPITVHRSAARPFSHRILETLFWPLSASGILSLLGLGAVLWLLHKAGWLGALLAAGIWWGFLFNVVRRTAIGDHELGPPDYSDLFSDVVAPAFRGIAATALLWVPALGYAILALRAGATPAEAATDPVVWLLVAAGIAYGPAAFLVAASGGSFLHLVNPAVGIQAIFRLGGDYWIAALSVGILLLVNVGVVLGAAVVANTGVPFLSAWIGETLTCYLPVVAARVLGVLLHVRGDAVGLGAEADYQEPVLGAATPRGTEPVLRTEPAPAEPAHELERAPEPAPTASAEPEPVAASEPAAPEPVAAPAPPPAADPAQAIADAVAASDPRAVALFAAFPGPDAVLDGRTLFHVARAASEAGEHALAARALHAAGTGADEKVAPNALLVLARVLERRLARPADARKALEYLVARWPESDAARQARAALGSA